MDDAVETSDAKPVDVVRRSEKGRQVRNVGVDRRVERYERQGVVKAYES